MDATLFFDESESKSAQVITFGLPVPHQPSLGGPASLFHLSGTIAVPQLGASLSWWVHRGSTKICLAAVFSGGITDVYFPLPMVTIATDQQILTCGVTRVTPGEYVVVWLDVNMLLHCLPFSLLNSVSHNGALSIELDETRKISRFIQLAAEEGHGRTVFPEGGGVTCAAVISVSRDPSTIMTSVVLSDGYDLLIVDVLDGSDQLDVVPFTPRELVPYSAAAKGGGIASFLPWGRSTRSQQWVALAPLEMSDGIVLAHVSGKVFVLSGSKGPAAAAHPSFFEVALPTGSYSHQLSLSATVNHDGCVTICTDCALPGTHVVTALCVYPGEATPRLEHVLESPTPGSVPFGHAAVIRPDGCTLAVVWLAEDLEYRPVTLTSLLHATPRSETSAMIQLASPVDGIQLVVASTPRLDCLLAVSDIFVLVESSGRGSSLYVLSPIPHAGAAGIAARVLNREVIPVPDTKETCARDAYLCPSATLTSLTGASASDIHGTAGDRVFVAGIQLVGAATNGATVLGQLILETANASADSASHHAYLELTSTARSNGFTCSPFTDDEVDAAIALALQPMEPVLRSKRHFAMQSRRFIFEQVSSELAQRIGFLVVTQLAFVFADPVATLKPIFRDLRTAIDLLSASLLTVHQLQSHLPLVVKELQLDTAVEDCFSVFIGGRHSLANLSHHVILVATEHLSSMALPPIVQIGAKRVWGDSLRERCPLACHMLIECNVATARTNRSAHIEALSSQVGLYLAQQRGLVDPWISLFTSVFPREVLDELRQIGHSIPALAPRLYRVALLRQLMPADSATKNLLISSHSVESYFLPDLLFVLPVLEVHAHQVHIHFTRLLIDVYLMLGRTAADNRQYSLACRHAVSARRLKDECPALAGMTIVDRQISILASRVVEVATASRQGQSLVDLPVKDPAIVKLLANKMFQLVSRPPASGIYKSGGASGPVERLEGTMLLLQFLARRRAYGLAARVAVDVAQLTRSSSQGSTQALEAVEQLVGMSLQFLQNIPDVVPPDSDAADEANELGGGFEQVTTESSSNRFSSRTESFAPTLSKGYSAAQQQATPGASLSSAGLSLVSKEPLSRAYIPQVALRLKQARCERILAAALQVLDPSKHPWTEFAEQEKLTQEVIRKELVGIMQWTLAEGWSVATGQDVSFVFEAEAQNLIYYGESSTSTWPLLVSRIMQHSSVANNFAPINKVVRSSLVNGNYKKVPYLLKDALKSCDPSGLISALLSSKRLLTEGDNEKRLPHSLQEEAIRAAYDYLKHRADDSSFNGIVIPLAVLDRVAVIARQITQNAAANGLPISELSHAFLTLLLLEGDVSQGKK